MKRPQFTPWIAPILACAAVFATVSLRPASVRADAPLPVLDAGLQRTLDFSDDEVEIFLPGEHQPGRLRQVLENKVLGATVLEDQTSHAVVKVAGGYDRGRVVAGTDPFRDAVPGVEVSPVLYVRGVPHHKYTRRVATTEILAILQDGTTADQLSQQTGALGVVPNPITNVARLKYASAYHALDAAKALAAAGVQVQPIFKVQYERKALNLPQDELFPDQWHLVNTGQQGGTAGVDVDVLPVWETNRGQGVIVGVIDDCLEVTHPDLRDNCPPVAALVHHDFNDNDDDPSPVIARGDGHGTCVSGLIAARQNNGTPNPNNGRLLGVSGVAPEATLYGLRGIGGPFSDAQIATAFTWAPGGVSVDITNNSWGPGGISLGGIDLLARAGLRDAATKGRNGRGTVTVFAAGNGRSETDDAGRFLPSASRYVVTVGAITATGVFSPYSNPGACLLVCAPGGGFGYFGADLRLTTTDVTGIGGFNPGAGDYSNTDYTRQMNGTSSATPVTSGVVALMLKANPLLGWRDVKEILASTARRIDPAAADWVIRPALGSNDPDRFFNEAHFKFNHDYGAGLVDAFSAVTRATSWKPLPAEISQTLSTTEPGTGTIIPDFNGPGQPVVPLIRTFDFSGKPNLRLEQIEVEVQITHPSRSDLEITLTSPSGVKSVLTPAFDPNGQPFDTNNDYKNIVFDDNGQLAVRPGGWTFSTTHHWGENSQGLWTLSVTDRARPGAIGRLIFSSVRMYGTNSGLERVAFDQQRASVNEPVGAPIIQPIIVRRFGPTTGSFSVDYQTTISSATAGSDYTAAAGTLNFADGETSKEIDITILDDTEPEDVEAINVVLSNLVDVDAGVSFGGVTLTTLDVIDSQTNAVTIVATDPIATETTLEDLPDTGEFTITRSKVTSTPLTVFYTINGTAREGSTPNDDFDPLPASGPFRVAVIPAFEASTKVIIKPRDDLQIEGSETVIATLAANGTDYSIGTPQTATVQILDNDRPVVQMVSVDDLAVEDPVPTNLASFQIKRSPATNLPLLVQLDFGGTQTLGTNYFLSYTDSFGNTVILQDPTSTNTVEIPAGEDTLTVFLTPKDDDFYQATKTVEISLRPNANYDFTFGFLTTVRMNIVDNDPFPDTKVPVATITGPANGARPEAGVMVELKGTATDTAVTGRIAQVSQVLYRVDGQGEFQQIFGFNPAPSVTFSKDVTAETIAGGFHTLEVVARDVDGNYSKTVATTFKRVKVHQLTVTPTTGGTVSGAKTTYEAGDTVKLTAIPASGSIFGGWSGDFTSSSKALSFTMPDSDVSVTANFAPNPFTADTAGVYSGLVQGAQFNLETSGYVTLTVGATGAVTGKLTTNGVVYSVKGEFLSNGTMIASVPRKNTTPLTLALVVDLSPSGTKRITGTMASPSFTAAIVADRAAYSKKVPAPSTVVKNYTILMPPANPIANTEQDPRGFGIGKIKIGTDGVVHFTGTLPDGTKASFNQALSKDNTWPLFLNPYKKKGVLLGNITIDPSQPTSDMNGTFDWYKPTSTKDLYFPLGFKVQDGVFVASIYTAPSTGTQALTGYAAGPGNSKVLLEEGSLLSSITKTTTFDTSNKVTATVVGEDKLAVQIVAAGGDFKGSFIHPVSDKKVTFTGILFQKREEAYAFFPGSSVPGINPQSGRVTLTKP